MTNPVNIEDLPVFLKCVAADEEHVFVRSDWIMEFLFQHLPREDAHRAWAILHAERVLAERGQEAADEFLEAFGVTEH